MNTDISNSIRAAKAGLSRFYDEGYYRWPESNLRIIFDNQDLDDPGIQTALETWQQQGVIKLLARPDVYLEMLKDFPRD